MVQAVAISGVVAGIITGALVVAITRMIAGKGMLIAVIALALLAAIPNSKFLEAETLDLSFKSSLFEES